MAKPAAPAFTLMRSNWAQEFLRVNGEELAQWIPKTLQKDEADAPKDLQSFIAYLMTGVPLCELVERCSPSSHWPAGADRPVPDVTCKHNPAAKPGSFHARENVANFIDACRKLGLPEISLFAPDDLIDQKNLKAVVNCLLHLSKIGAQNGINPPDIVQYELDLDKAAHSEDPAEATEILVPEQFELTQEQFEAVQAAFVRVDEAQALAVTRKDLATALKADEKIAELRAADSGFDKRFEHLESEDPEPIDLGDFLFWWRHVARRKEHVISRRQSTVDAKELESQKPEARPRLLSHVPGHSRRGSAPVSFEDFKYLPHIPDRDDALDSLLAEELNHNILDVRVRRYANPEEVGGYWYRFGKANAPRINLRMVRGLLIIRDGHNWDGVVHYIQNRLGTLAEDES